MSLDTLLPTLTDPEHPPSAKELTSLSGLGGENRDRFLDVWGTLSIQRRRDVIDMLGQIIEDNVEFDFSTVFMAGLLDPDVQVRAESIKALWEYEEDDLVAILLRMLHDPEAIVRAEAALGLGRFLMRAELTDREDKLSEDVEEALRAVSHDEDELTEVRGRAIEALGVRGKEWVHDLIEEAYGTGDRRFMISAVHAMGRNADLEWMPIIIDEMGSDDAEMRFEAATAAGGLADEEAIPHLAELTGEDDAEVQEAAITALGLIGGPSARSVLHAVASESSDDRVLEAVRDALAEDDFVEDPLGFKLHLDDAVADDASEDDDE
ncbi:MAG: HEAT repeat domain-containing protein [Kofleriaceae bacterium]